MTPAAVLLYAALLVLPACGRSVASDQTVRSPTGAILEPGDLGAQHLHVGDCIRGPIPDEVEAMTGVPCHREHLAQVFALTDGTETCLDVFERDMGRLVLRTDLPVVDLSALIVTDAPERVVCLLEFAEPISEDLLRPLA